MCNVYLFLKPFWLEWVTKFVGSIWCASFTSLGLLHLIANLFLLTQNVLLSTDLGLVLCSDRLRKNRFIPGCCPCRAAFRKIHWIVIAKMVLCLQNNIPKMSHVPNKAEKLSTDSYQTPVQLSQDTEHKSVLILSFCICMHIILVFIKF